MMKIRKTNGLFNPNGCLTSQAIRGYLDGSLRISGRLEVEKHLSHCRICSEALEGFKHHQPDDFLRSDLEYLSGRIRKRYTSARAGSSRLPVMITFSILISLVILLIIFYIIRQFLIP
jgi:hypothetical protein